MIKGFQHIYKLLIVICLITILQPLNASQKKFYASIDIGSKGIKLCVLNYSIKSTLASEKVVYDTAINTDVIKFTKESQDATLNAITTLYRIATEKYNVLNHQIYFAISSGVKQSADRDKKNEYVYELIETIKRNDTSRSVELVSIYNESYFSHRSLISEDAKMKSIIIDIGSGNSKGGYFITESLFNTFNIPWGTKSTTNFVEKKCDSQASIIDFYAKLHSKLEEIESNDIQTAIQKCGITNYNFNIEFSGGIAWAVATLMRPRENGKRVDITYAELMEFHNQLFSNYDNFIKQPSNPEYELERSRVLAVFNQRSLLAGSGLLLKIMQNFDKKSNGKKFVYLKNNRAGWLPAFILAKIDVK